MPKGRQRVLLAALLLYAGKPVAIGALAEVVWDGAPPPGAEVTLRAHVMRLRRVLGPRAGARLVTGHPGYLLHAADDEVDLLRFRGLCRDGGAALRQCAWDRADGLLGEALGLWRGTPLDGIPAGSLSREEVPGLEALRLQAEEWRTEAALHLGRHDDLIPGLQALTARHSLRERFHAQLMLALYRSGRQAEALAAYQHARQLLVDELGTEPGAELRELHRQILSADPALAVSEPTAPAPGHRAGVVPRELPAPAAGFVGRAGELATLTGLLDRPAGQAPAVVISAIGGTAGVGKTALALHWAHQVAGRFPGGQLYVNLRGYDPDRPVPAADALAGFLLSLGVPGQDIPAEEDQRAARYRSLLAGKKMLVVLDNAGSVEQVRPLLPGTPGCAVVVTSRDSLAGLVVRDGAKRLDLDLLPLADAVELLTGLIGEQVGDDLKAITILAEQCCRLPLALRLAAELAVSRPTVPLGELTEELGGQQKRLDLLDTIGDPHTQVRAVFSWSYRHLDPDVAHAFRLLGLHPSVDFEPYAAAALTDTTLERAQRLLGQLARAHMVQPTGQGRYTLHDLLRVYARELAAFRGSEQERHEALTRLFDYYLHTATIAMNTIFPGESDRRAFITLPSSPCPGFTSIAAARAWLDNERATLASVSAFTAAFGWPTHTTRLAATLFRYLETGGYYPALTAIHDSAGRAARETGDRAAEAEALQDLIVVDLRQGRYQQAANRIRQTLTLHRETGNRLGEARALGNLGIACFLQGSYQQAGDYLQQALVLHRETGNRASEARHLSNLSLIELRLGSYQQASEHLEQALAICRDGGNRDTEAYALSNLGVIKSRLGNDQQAGEHLEQALAICRDTGNRDCEAYALSNLGVIKSRLGNDQQASEHLEQALAICRDTGDQSSEAEALNGLGEVLLASRRTEDARARQSMALSIAERIGEKYEQARAHTGLARSYQATGGLGQARHHWQQALALYSELGATEAEWVRAQVHDQR